MYIYIYLYAQKSHNGVYLDRRHHTNDLTPAIESLGPDGQHMLTTSKKIFFGTTFLMPSKFKNLENPTIPHINPTQEQRVTKSGL